MPADEQRLREELVNACKVLYRAGIVDLAGHLSAKLDDERILIKPRGVSWMKVTPDDLVVINFQGQHIGGTPGEKPPLQEWPIHTEVYKARPDVGSVLHAHPPDSTLMASLGIQMEPLTRDLATFGAGVAMMDLPTDPDALINTPQNGAAVATALRRKSVVLLKYHGTVVGAETIGGVCLTAYTLERAAQTMLKVASVQPLPVLSHGARARMIAQFDTRPPAVIAMLIAERWKLLQSYFLD